MLISCWTIYSEIWMWTEEYIKFGKTFTAANTLRWNDVRLFCKSLQNKNKKSLTSEKQNVPVFYELTTP